MNIEQPSHELLSDDAPVISSAKPVAPIESDAPLSDDQVLMFAQEIRTRAVHQILAEGNFPVNDKDTMGTLAKMLDGLDKQALGKKRLDTDNKATDVAAQANLILGEIIKLQGNVDPFLNTNAPVMKTVSERIPDKLLDEDITIVPGELESGNAGLTYADFSEKHLKRN